MKKFTITLFETQREIFLSVLSFNKINEFSVKKSESKDCIDISFQCEPIMLYQIGFRVQFLLGEQKPTNEQANEK